VRARARQFKTVVHHLPRAVQCQEEELGQEQEQEEPQEPPQQPMRQDDRTRQGRTTKNKLWHLSPGPPCASADTRPWVLGFG
jgi:hypothetical protein